MTTLYDAAVKNGAFFVAKDGSKNIDFEKLLEIPEAVERLKEIIR